MMLILVGGAVLIAIVVLLFYAAITGFLESKKPTGIPPSSRPPPKPPDRSYSRTIDSITYIYRNGFWFRQFPFNEITLELCVGCGEDWIKEISAEQDRTRLEAKQRYIEEYYHSISNCDINNRFNALEMQMQCNVARTESLQLQRDMQACCCTRDLSQSERIDDLRMQLALMNNRAKTQQLYQQIRVNPYPVYQNLTPITFATREDYERYINIYLHQ